MILDPCRTCEHSESEHEQHPLLWLCRRCDCTARPEATERGERHG